MQDAIFKWQAKLRMIFITRLVLWRYSVRLRRFELPEAIQLAQEEFDNHLAKALKGMADRTEGNESTQKQDLSKAYDPVPTSGMEGLAEPQNQFSPQIELFLLLSRRIALLADSLKKEFEYVDTLRRFELLP